MESKTKSGISREIIAAMVNKHFPGEEILSVEELTEGMFNSAYVIRGSGILERGSVLKIGPGPEAELLTYEKDILRAEVEVYRLLRDRPVKIPGLLAWDYSREHIPCDYFFHGTHGRNSVEKLCREDFPRKPQAAHV